MFFNSNFLQTKVSELYNVIHFKFATTYDTYEVHIMSTSVPKK